MYLKTINHIANYFWMIVSFICSLGNYALAQNSQSVVFLNENPNPASPVSYRIFRSITDMWSEKPNKFFKGNSTTHNLQSESIDENSYNIVYFINGSLSQQAPIYLRVADTISVSLNDMKQDYIFKGKFEYDWNFYKKSRDAGFPLMGADWEIQNGPDYLNSVLSKKQSFDNFFRVRVDSLTTFYAQRIKRDAECTFLKSILDHYPDYLSRKTQEHDRFMSYVSSFFYLFDQDYVTQKSWTYYLSLRSWNLFMSKYKYKNTSEAGQIASAKHLNDKLANDLIYLILKKEVNKTIKSDDKEIVEFIKNCKDSVLVSDIQSRIGIDILKSKYVKKDDSVLKSVLHTINNSKITWEDFLDVNNGQYIFIDIWASWCGPCKKEMVILDDKKKQFGNKKILFVSISIDENKDDWSKGLLNLKIHDELLNFRIDMNSNLGQQILPDKLIPKFIFINDKGDITSFNAPRPSSEIFEAWLNEKCQNN